MTVTPCFFSRTRYVFHLQLWEKYGKVEKPVFTGSFMLINSFRSCILDVRDTKEWSALLAECFTLPTQTTRRLTCPIAYFCVCVCENGTLKRACSSLKPISDSNFGILAKVSQHTPFQDDAPFVANSSCFSAPHGPKRSARSARSGSSSAISSWMRWMTPPRGCRWPCEGTKRGEWNGGFLSHRGTPSYHPFLIGMFHEINPDMG